VVNLFEDKKIEIVEKYENPANVPEVRAIEDFWSILKGKVSMRRTRLRKT